MNLTDNLLDSSTETLVIKIPRHPSSKSSARLPVKAVKEHSLGAIIVNNATKVILEFNDVRMNCTNLGGNLWMLAKHAIPIDWIQHSVNVLITDGVAKEFVYIPREQNLDGREIYATELLTPNSSKGGQIVLSGGRIDLRFKDTPLFTDNISSSLTERNYYEFDNGKTMQKEPHTVEPTTPIEPKELDAEVATVATNLNDAYPESFGDGSKPIPPLYPVSGYETFSQWGESKAEHQDNVALETAVRDRDSAFIPSFEAVPRRYPTRQMDDPPRIVPRGGTHDQLFAVHGKNCNPQKKVPIEKSGSGAPRQPPPSPSQNTNSDTDFVKIDWAS